MNFPAGFEWGVATSAYQIEGACRQDGRGPSIWDRFCDRPGAIWGGQRGDVACDHYHRFPQDIELLREIGVSAYRFSVSWPRVIPDGQTRVNEPGLAFYDRLVDECLKAGVTPHVTLYHWDLPQALEEQGGWLQRDVADRFAEYTTAVVARLSDRVRHWITINEPQVFLTHGYLEGRHAPGRRLSLSEALQASHHVLLAHGKSAAAIRSAARVSPSVGLAIVGVVCMPKTPRPQDVAAARQATLAVQADNLFNNTWWLDPVVTGAYPADGLKGYGDRAPMVAEGDMKWIQQPLDFIGLNVYRGVWVQAGPDGQPIIGPHEVGQRFTASGWQVTPESLHWGPRFIYEHYGLPIVIAENGMANTDWVDLDGQVHDPQRVDFIRRHLRELARAIAHGTDVCGYFYWSLLDNFEWAEGYRERFGLVHVDFETQQRRLKDSAYWYRTVIESGGAAIEDCLQIAIADPAR